MAAARLHRGLLGVLGAYAVAAAILPTLSATAIHDDWVYSRSVSLLVNDGTLKVLDLSAANGIFDVLWGALFAKCLGLSLGVLRLSSVVLMMLSGVAFYALCRQATTSRSTAAFGAAVYLFNPLAYVIGFSFMTDGHFLALLVIATACYAQGLAVTGVNRSRWLLLGSVVSALAVWSRTHGVLIPAAVVLYLLVSRQLRSRGGLRVVAQVALVPALATLAMYAWYRWVNGVPLAQSDFSNNAQNLTAERLGPLLRRHSFIQPAYVGFFVLPVAAAAVAGVRHLGRAAVAWWGWAVAGLWTLILAWGYLKPAGQAREFPWAGSWLLPTDVGPIANIGDRPPLISPGAFQVLTVVLLASAVVFILLAVRRPVTPAETPQRQARGLCITLGLVMAAGALPPSFTFWPGTLDRYLLPLLPFAVVLGLMALPTSAASRRTGWVVVALVGAISVAGTRDFLVLHRSIWRVADETVAAGVPPMQLDGGAGWVGHHVGRNSQTERSAIDRSLPNQWWVRIFAPDLDPVYLISLSPVPGYETVGSFPYSSWLRSGPQHVLLQKRAGAPDVRRAGAAPTPGR